MESIETLTTEEAKILAKKLKIKKLEYNVQEQSQKKFLGQELKISLIYQLSIKDMDNRRVLQFVFIQRQMH